MFLLVQDGHGLVELVARHEPGQHEDERREAHLQVYEHADLVGRRLYTDRADHIKGGVGRWIRVVCPSSQRCGSREIVVESSKSRCPLANYLPAAR